MSCKPRQIIGNIFNLARDYNRYCGRVIGNLGANIPVIAWILDLVRQDSTFTCSSPRLIFGYIGDPSAVNFPQLITVPANVPAIVGGRWNGSKFLTTASDGSTLNPYVTKSTPKGLVNVFTAFANYAAVGYLAGEQVKTRTTAGNYVYLTALAPGTAVSVTVTDADIGSDVADAGGFNWRVGGYATIEGELLELARTNKVTCRKLSPTDLTNVSKAGNASSVLSLVADSADLAARGIDAGNSNVYLLNNDLGGAGAAFMLLEGLTGNTNKHSGIIWMKTNGVSCNLSWNATALGEFGATDAVVYTEVMGENVTPTAANNKIMVVVPLGGKAWCILPKLEEGAFSTSQAVGADPVAAVTRAASRLLDTTAGRADTDNTSIDLTVTPDGAGQSGVVLWGSYVDANNLTQVILNVNDITFRKRVASADTDLVFAFTHGSEPFRVLAKQIPTGMSLQVALIGDSEPVAQTNVNTTALQLDANFENMSDGNNANHAAGVMPVSILNNKELSW